MTKRVGMMKHLLAFCGWFAMSLSLIFANHIIQLRKENHNFYKIEASPVAEEVRLDCYDERAFYIARILERRNLSNSGVELLDLAQLILDKSEEIGVSPSLILAMIEVESTFEPCARSRVGAKGLMQVMPHRILGYRRAREEFAFNYHLFYEPSWNIEFGADYLGRLIKRFGNVERALSAYNQGPTRVSTQLKESDYRACSYAKRVLNQTKRYDIRI